MNAVNHDHAGQVAGLAGDFTQAVDPLRLFAAWFEEASRSEAADPNAMVLATVDGDGLPNARVVLMKGFDERGVVFYTNVTSRKGQELEASRRAALVFHWKSLSRQVRMGGAVEPVDAEEADRYFAVRPREAQIGAWASRQSTPLESRSVFDAQMALYAERFPERVPRPPHWHGYRIVPRIMEFWQARPFRHHDRIEFRRQPGGGWSRSRLYP